MANIIKHIRSGTEGKIPLITDIGDGEIAVNFFDGLLFIRKDDGTGQVIIQIGQYLATEISYDNVLSGLTATTVQDAIDEIALDFLTSTDILDTENLVEEDPLRAPSQRAVKAYVDANVLGSLVYQGVWDADANVPALASGVGVIGDFFIVSVAGTTLLDGENSWAVGDQVIFNGTIWEKTPSFSDVNSVHGRIGVVIGEAGDYDAVQIDYDNLVSGLAATNVKAAIDEIDARIDFIETNPQTLATTLGVGNITAGSNIIISDGDQIVSLVANSLTYPVVDGVAGQVVTTDGLGTLTLVDPPAGGADPTIEEVLISGEDAFGQRITGVREIIVEDSSPFITIKDTNNSIGSNALLGNIDFKDQNNTRWMYLGQASSGSLDATLLHEDNGNLILQTSNGLVINKMTDTNQATGQQVAVPAARVSFIPRTSLGACSITNVINVLEVRRIAVGLYEVRFDNGTINGTILANTGMMRCYSKTTQSSSVSHTKNWSSGPNLSGGVGQTDIQFYNTANATIDPTGGSNNYQHFVMWVN